MTNKWSRLLLCVVFAGLTAAWSVAQDSDTGAKSKDSVRTVTGCLTKSGGGDEYLLTGNDGSTWEVHAKGTSVDLAGNVNHTVEAKGVVKNSKMHNLKEDSKTMASDAGVDKNRAEHGHLTITDLHSINDSCQK
jgi:hypothetical protein